MYHLKYTGANINLLNLNGCMVVAKGICFLSLWLSSGVILRANDDRSASTRNTAEEMPASEGLFQEVHAQVRYPLRYDWRGIDYEIGLTYLNVDEANNYESWGAGIEIAFISSGFFNYMLSMHRFVVEGTESSSLLGKTPFKQKAGVNRYEIGGGGEFILLENRGFSYLSPTLVDFLSTFSLSGQVIYSHANDNMIPKKQPTTSKDLGKIESKPRYGIVLGFRYKIFLPSDVSLGFLWNYHYGMGGVLPRWKSFGLTASIGIH